MYDASVFECDSDEVLECGPAFAQLKFCSWAKDAQLLKFPSSNGRLSPSSPSCMPSKITNASGVQRGLTKTEYDKRYAKTEKGMLSTAKSRALTIAKSHENLGMRVDLLANTAVRQGDPRENDWLP